MAKVINNAGEVIGTVVDDAEKAIETNPTQAAATVVKDVTAVKQYATDNALGINTRSLEKLIAYGAAAVGATNGFTTLAMPAWLRAALVFASGLAIAADKVTG
jgi:hypothetical protein